jgi:3D (Asp-Asp-Asp) domain-containing protein
LETEAEIQMNCPSIKKHKAGLTATGTTPIPYATAACDRMNLGKTFRIEGFTTVTCTDTGGAIKGENRFDIVFPTKQDAIEFGVKYYPYQEV